MKPRFLFPNSYKKYGIIFCIPFFVLGLFCLFIDFKFEWLSFSLPQNFLFNDGGAEIKSQNLNLTEIYNFTDELATIGLIISLIIIAFSKIKFEDEYVEKVRLESLQWAIYINFALLILATVFVHGLLYFQVLVFNMFTPLIIFIIRFHFLLFYKEKN